jgi:adenine phosphoribosyltransferase
MLNEIDSSTLHDQQTIQELIQIVNEAPVYEVSKIQNRDWSNYEYFIYPFKGITFCPPLLELNICRVLSKAIPPGTEVILSIDTDGISIAKFIGAELGIPVLIVKEFHYNQDNFTLSQKAAYHERSMFIPALTRQKHVAFIDAVVSSGGTALAVIETLEKNDCTVSGVFTVFNKPKLEGANKIIETGQRFVAVVDVIIENGSAVASRSKHFNGK